MLWPDDLRYTSPPHDHGWSSSLSSVVRGQAGLFHVVDDDYCPVRMIPFGDIPDLIQLGTHNLVRLGGNSGAPFSGSGHGSDGATGVAASDLRDRLRAGREQKRAPVPDAVGAEGESEAPPGDGQHDDIRTLSVDYDAHGERHKRWRTLAREVSVAKFPDWPFEDGSSQCMHLIKHWDRHAENGLVWLDKWLIDRGVGSCERTGIEMKCLVTCLHQAGTYDHLNVPVLACLETIGRRIAQIVEAYSGDARQPR